MIDSDTNEYTNQTLKIVLISFLLAAVILLTLYTSKQYSGITPDTKSYDRLNTLNNVLSYYFGRAWPYVLIFIMLISSVLFYLLYNKLNQDQTININDNSAKTLIKISTIFLVLFSISMIMIATNTYLTEVNYKKTGDIPNYIPTEELKQTKQTILLILGTGLFVLFFLILVIRFLWFKFKNQDPNI